jgi:hypothetical protein
MARHLCASARRNNAESAAVLRLVLSFDIEKPTSFLTE